MTALTILSILLLSLASQSTGFTLSSDCVCGDTEGTEGVSLQGVSWRYSLKTIKNGNVNYCSADLISDRHLITSKDCLDDMDSVLLLKNMNDPDSTALPIKKIHEVYLEVTNVIELENPVTLNSTHGTVCVPGIHGDEYHHYMQDSGEHILPKGTVFTYPEFKSGDVITRVPGDEMIRVAKDRLTYAGQISFKTSEGSCPGKYYSIMYMQAANKKAPVWVSGVINFKTTIDFCFTGKTDNWVVDSLPLDYYSVGSEIGDDAIVCPVKKVA